MINLKDIRVGNWLYYRNYLTGDEMLDAQERGEIEMPYNLQVVTPSVIVEIWESERHPFEQIKERKSHPYELIPLTEEWLLKFEWEHLDYRSKWQKHNCPFQLEEPDSEDEGYLLLFDNERLHELPSIKFVHQLQNLYYALTGTELIITKRKPWLK